MIRIVFLIAALILCLSGTPVLAQARVLKDLSYGRDSAQAMDVYLPGLVRDAPIIVMLHGGAWKFGDKSNRGTWKAKVDRWGARGTIFVSINTRLLPTGPLEQAEDAARALAFVQLNATGWGGDPARLILMGHSAGAHIAALLSADPVRAEAYGAERWLGTVALDTAALDIEALMRGDPARAYVQAFGRDPAYWRETSPQAQISARSVPVLAVCSSRRTAPCPAAEAFVGALRARGVAGDVLPVDLTHRRINTDLGMASGYTGAVESWMEQQGLWRAAAR